MRKIWVMVTILWAINGIIHLMLGDIDRFSYGASWGCLMALLVYAIVRY